MTTILTERRKADRAKMAAMVAALCDELDASHTLRDDATFIHGDGSRPLPEDRKRLVVSISAGDARVSVDFDGGSRNSNRDCYCVPWNVAYGSDKQFSPAFGSAVGATVNPFHRRKCTGFADGIDDLLARLRAAIECINSGEAFLAPAKEQSE